MKYFREMFLNKWQATFPFTQDTVAFFIFVVQIFEKQKMMQVYFYSHLSYSSVCDYDYWGIGLLFLQAKKSFALQNVYYWFEWHVTSKTILPIDQKLFFKFSNWPKIVKMLIIIKYKNIITITSLWNIFRMQITLHKTFIIICNSMVKILC